MPHGLLILSRRMSDTRWREIESMLCSKLAVYGLDLVKAFPIELYNSDEKCAKYPLPLSTSSTSHTSTHLGILIGNTKRLWDPFLAHLSSDPAKLCNAEHPIHDYVSNAIATVLQELSSDKYLSNSEINIATNSLKNVGAASDLEYDVRYPYDEGERFVHFQRLAHLAGLAYLNPNCFLCVSPIHGPWIALRAVITFQFITGPNVSEYVSHPAQNPFPDGDAYLNDLTQEIIADYQANYSVPDYKMDWEKLVHVRTYCGKFLPLEGREHKYSELQLKYHYTKDRQVLLEAVAASSRGK